MKNNPDTFFKTIEVTLFHYMPKSMVNKNKQKSIKARFKEYDDYHFSCGWIYFTLTLSIIAISIWALLSAPFGGFIFTVLTFGNLLSLHLYSNDQFDNWIYEHKLYCVKCSHPLVTKYKIRRGRRPKPNIGYRKYGEVPKKCPFCSIPISKALGLN